MSWQEYLADQNVGLMGLSSQPSCFSLPSTGAAGMSRHAWVPVWVCVCCCLQGGRLNSLCMLDKLPLSQIPSHLLYILVLRSHMHHRAFGLGSLCRAKSRDHPSCRLWWDLRHWRDYVGCPGEELGKNGDTIENTGETGDGNSVSGPEKEVEPSTNPLPHPCFHIST